MLKPLIFLLENQQPQVFPQPSTSQEINPNLTVNVQKSLSINSNSNLPNFNNTVTPKFPLPKIDFSNNNDNIFIR